MKRFGIYGGVKLWVLPMKWLVILTTVLRYRSDELFNCVNIDIYE